MQEVYLSLYLFHASFPELYHIERWFCSQFLQWIDPEAGKARYEINLWGYGLSGMPKLHNKHFGISISWNRLLLFQCYYLPTFFSQCLEKMKDLQFIAMDFDWTTLFSSQLYLRLPLSFGGLHPSMSLCPLLPALQAFLGTCVFILHGIKKSSGDFHILLIKKKINRCVWIFRKCSQSHRDNLFFCMKRYKHQQSFLFFSIIQIPPLCCTEYIPFVMNINKQLLPLFLKQQATGPKSLNLSTEN